MDRALREHGGFEDDLRGPAVRPSLTRVRTLLWRAVLEILRGEETVLVYGPGGRAKVVPRRIAERLHAERRIRAAASVEDARDRLGLPSVGITAADGFDGVDRSVMIGWDPGKPEGDRGVLVEVPPRHAMSQGWTPPTLATWTCEVCREVHPVDHAGLMLFACGGMICCSCENRWPEHQGACVPCADLARAHAAGAPPPFDLTDTEE